MNFFGAAARQRVFDEAERRTERYAESRLFQYFPHRGFGESFAVVDLSLRERVVTVERAMNDEGVEFIPVLPPDERAGGVDGGIFGLRRAHVSIIAACSDEDAQRCDA